MNPYYYQKNDIPVNMNLEMKNHYWARYQVDFPTAHPTIYAEYNTVRGLYYQPTRKNPAPLAIMIHGMGDYSAVPWKMMAPSLAKKGIAAFVLYLPFHSTRMPGPIRERIPKLTPEEWFEGTQLSVIDIFQVLDWAATRPELNAERNAVLGVSYGGLVAAIAMAIDTRVKAGVLVVTGGNSGKINWLSKSKSYASKYPQSEEEYQRGQTIYREYLETVKSHGFENVKPPETTYLTDPRTFCDDLKNRPLIMFNATRDKYVPREAVIDFWEACGKPRLIWFPIGHIGIWIFYPIIARVGMNFLKNNLQKNKIDIPGMQFCALLICP